MSTVTHQHQSEPTPSAAAEPSNQPQSADSATTGHESPSEIRSRNSRINGAKSKGPTSAEGKAISSQNARKFSLSIENILPEVSACDTFRALRDSFIAEFQPASPTEMRAIERLTYFNFQLHMIWELRAALTNDHVNEARARLYRIKASNPGVTAKAIEDALNDPQSAYVHFARSEVNCDRMYRAALREITSLVKNRSTRPGVLAGVFHPYLEPGPTPEIKNVENEPTNPEAEAADEQFSENEPSPAAASSTFRPLEPTPETPGAPAVWRRPDGHEWELFLRILKTLKAFPDARDAVRLTVNEYDAAQTT